MKVKRWKIKVPYHYQGKRIVFRFEVEARSRDQAIQLAHAIIQQKCPIEPDLSGLKMVRA